MNVQNTVESQGIQFERARHGSLFDRGASDSYYNRPPSPHWFPEGSYRGPKITELTSDEIAKYMEGYEYNEKFGSKKNWR